MGQKMRLVKKSFLGDLSVKPGCKWSQERGSKTLTRVRNISLGRWPFAVAVPLRMLCDVAHAARTGTQPHPLCSPMVILLCYLLADGENNSVPIQNRSRRFPLRSKLRGLITVQFWSDGLANHHRRARASLKLRVPGDKPLSPCSLLCNRTTSSLSNMALLDVTFDPQEEGAIRPVTLTVFCSRLFSWVHCPLPPPPTLSLIKACFPQFWQPPVPCQIPRCLLKGIL